MARAAERAYDAIRDGIATGALEPGSHLGEEELADQIGVSRTPVREAIRRLASEGLVEIVPNRGAHVAAWSERDLAEIFDLRAVLEGFAARLAARRATPEDVRRLRALADRMEALAASSDEDRLDAISTLNHEFHGTIIELADNRHLSSLVDGLVQVRLVHRTFRRYTEAELQRSMGHHRELIEALERGDVNWAGTAMRSHVYAARSVLENDLGLGDDQG